MTNVILFPQKSGTIDKSPQEPSGEQIALGVEELTVEDLHTIGLINDGDFLEAMRQAMREVPD